MQPFYANWLRTMQDAQDVYQLDGDCERGWTDCNGTVADTVPHMPGLFGHRPADPSWGVALMIIYENTVNYYGDVGLARQLYDTSRRYVEHSLRAADNKASPSSGTAGVLTYHYFGDWLQPGRVQSTKLISQMASSFNFLQGLRIMRDIASLLGETDDATYYGTEFQKRRAAFHSLYFNAHTGTYADGSQAALVFALYIDAP